MWAILHTKQHPTQTAHKHIQTLSLQQGDKETTVVVSSTATVEWGRSDTTDIKLILISMRSLYLLSYRSSGQMPSRGEA